MQKDHQNNNCCCFCFLLLKLVSVNANTLLPLNNELISANNQELITSTNKLKHRRKIKSNKQSLKALFIKKFFKTWLLVFSFALFTVLILTPVSYIQVSAALIEPAKTFVVTSTATLVKVTEKTMLIAPSTSKLQKENYLSSYIDSNNKKKIKYFANYQQNSIKNSVFLPQKSHSSRIIRGSDVDNGKFINENGAFISSNYGGYNNGYKNNYHYQMSSNANPLKNVKGYSHRLPYNVILILPSRESDNDKFGLTSEKARPVIDISIEDIVFSGQMPNGWINITYHDSRYWEDTLLAERHATFGVVQAYCEDRLDAILGFADAYSLATVSKISAGFGEGVPVITTTGLNSQIGSKKSYPYVTRMTGSYIQMAESLYRFIAYHSEEDDEDNLHNQKPKVTRKSNSQTNLNYKNLVFMYHDKRRAINRPPIQGSKGENADDFISSHCYFSLHAIKSYFKETSEHFKESWKFQTPHVAFDEELPRTRTEVIEWVKMASKDANG